MAYLGNAPARNFISFERQVFTIVNSQTAYTLDHSVNNENDLRLVINNIVQEPGSGKAYTASGTTLTLSAALTNGTDEMYCVFFGRAVATNAPGAGSVGTSQLASEAVTNAKVASSIITGQTAETSIATDDLILLSDTSASGALKKMTRANFVSGVGGVNTPAFYGELGSTQSVSDNTATKVEISSETFDTDNCYDNSTNYRFTPTTSGKYFIFGNVFCDPGNADDLVYGIAYIYKNGSEYARSKLDFRNNGGRDASISVSALVSLNGSSDYVELYGNTNAADNSGTTFFPSNTTFFGGYKIIE